jgi:hypothetical protein
MVSDLTIKLVGWGEYNEPQQAIVRFDVGLRHRSAQPTLNDFLRHRLGDFHPIHGGGDDAAGRLTK